VRVEFWGTRGSIAKAGPSTVRYGGNTSCVEVRSARGTLVIIDCGTGGHSLGQKFMSAGAQGLRGHILISHTHWDHIQGIPFFAPLFVPGNEWDIYGPKGLGQSLREALAGQMQYTYFPVTLDQYEAKVRYHDLVEGSFEIEDIKVSTRYLNHTALSLGYRLTADGVAVVYACDHEPYSRTLANGEGEMIGQDLRHAEFVRGADLLIHDAQYTANEYPAKVGWGHSPIEYAVKLAQQARVKRIALTHHDPLRDDDELDRLLAGVRARLQEAGSSLDVFAAAEGQSVDVMPSHMPGRLPDGEEFQAKTLVGSALMDQSVMLRIADAITAATLSDAIRAEGIHARFLSDGDEASKLIAEHRLALGIIEHDLPQIDGLAACRAIRRQETDGEQLPLVMVAAKEDRAAGDRAGVTDWLIKPFSAAYARTKIRAWVLRTACRWIRGAIPENEQQRLASLRALQLLDTEPEDRFDRITRLARALLNAPIAAISLIDETRQWLKSCYGLGTKEISRDAAFCAHVVYDCEPLIVPDALLDERFADNPFVINEPRVRFYAGCPLVLDDGTCVGTLCVLDTRPRFLEGADIGGLRDLADLAVREIQADGKRQTTTLDASGSAAE
jgi:phosphoribosyl 1,2-cyclic phosphodiesterase/CheY-like chemotaxis protein